MSIDRSSWWWRKGRPMLVIFVALLVAGILFEPLQSAAWTETRARQQDLNLKDLSDNLGQGVLLGVLGGFRSMLADFAWIREYVFWEKKQDPAETEACVRLAATLDPDNLLFWDNGSDIIGKDIPSWSMHRNSPPTDEEWDQIKRQYANRALDFLERGLKFKPNNFQLFWDEAIFYGPLRLNDPPKAAEEYRLAAEVTNHPYLALEFYLRLLRQMGQDREAYDYLLKFYSNLPAAVPAVQRCSFWSWIRGFENVLKIPPELRQPESKAPPGWNEKDYKDDFNDLLPRPQ